MQYEDEVCTGFFFTCANNRKEHVADNESCQVDFEAVCRLQSGCSCEQPEMMIVCWCEAVSIVRIRISIRSASAIQT